MHNFKGEELMKMHDLRSRLNRYFEDYDLYQNEQIEHNKSVGDIEDIENHSQDLKTRDKGNMRAWIKNYLADSDMAQKQRDHILDDLYIEKKITYGQYRAGLFYQTLLKKVFSISKSPSNHHHEREPIMEQWDRINAGLHSPVCDYAVLLNRLCFTKDFQGYRADNIPPPTLRKVRHALIMLQYVLNQ